MRHSNTSLNKQRRHLLWISKISGAGADSKGLRNTARVHSNYWLLSSVISYIPGQIRWWWFNYLVLLILFVYVYKIRTKKLHLHTNFAEFIWSCQFQKPIFVPTRKVTNKRKSKDMKKWRPSIPWCGCWACPRGEMSRWARPPAAAASGSAQPVDPPHLQARYKRRTAIQNLVLSGSNHSKLPNPNSTLIFEREWDMFDNWVVIFQVCAANALLNLESIFLA